MSNEKPKSKIENSEIINKEQLLHLIRSMGTYEGKELHDRALVSILYLTAARISEVVRSIRKYQVEIQAFDRKQFLVIHNVVCLKRRENNKAKRNIPINMDKDKELVGYFIDYIKTLDPEEVLFQISRQHAHNIIKKITGNYWCHYFRHLRCSHLTSLEGFNSAELRHFNGWTDDKPAAKYVHLNWRDVARRMI